VRAVGRQHIYLIPAAGGEPRRLTFDDRYISGLAWTADGHEIVFSSGGSFCRVSKSGGNPRLLAGIGESCWVPAIPRYGRRLAFARGTRDDNIWRIEAPQTKGAAMPAEKLIASTREDANPVFSPDGKRIAFTSSRSGMRQVWACNSDGSNPVQLTSFSEPGAELSSWSPGGKQIAFNSALRGNWDVYVIGSEGGTARRLTTDIADDVRPSWSGDGRWIYFGSNRTGAYQVWKIPAEGGTPVQVTRKGGMIPFESPDGKFVYYTKGRGVNNAWRVPVEGGEEVPVLENLRSQWTITADGLYFLGQAKDAAPSGKWFIQFFDFATRQVTPAVALEKEPEWLIPPAVSPDGRTFLYNQVDTGEADLMLVEDFR
jgi:Tol biopolymer transport system component